MKSLSYPVIGVECRIWRLEVAISVTFRTYCCQVSRWFGQFSEVFKLIYMPCYSVIHLAVYWSMQLQSPGAQTVVYSVISRVSLTSSSFGSQRLTYKLPIVLEFLQLLFIEQSIWSYSGSQDNGLWLCANCQPWRCIDQVLWSSSTLTVAINCELEIAT